MSNGKGDISLQMRNIMTEYNQEVRNAFEKSSNGVAAASVNKLKSSSPKNAKHHYRKYAEGWARKKDKGLGYTVYNRTNWQLTHLLENGHVIRNAKGTYGRTSGIKHIAPVEEWANSELVERIERELEK